MRSGQGNPDESRSARYVLKDYVNGKLLFCHPPPAISEVEFNQQTHEISLRRVAGKKRAPVTRVTVGADTFVAPPSSGKDGLLVGSKSRAIDKDFFGNNTLVSSRPFIQGSARHGEAYSRATIYPHQNTVANDGTPLDSRTMAGITGEGSKHHKKAKRAKQRSGKGYD